MCPKVIKFSYHKVFGSLFILSCLLLNGCVKPPKENTIVISGPFEAINLDPATTGYIFQRLEVLQTLVNVSQTGELTSGLATHWKSVDQGKNWQIQLKDKVLFHNGKTMTASDVKQALQIAMRKPGPLKLAQIKTITIKDDLTLNIELTKAYLPFPSILTNYSTAVLAPESYAQNGEVNQLLATGPYKITEFTPPHRINTQLFEQYWAGQPAIKEVEYITGHRSESRAMMVKTRQADIVYNLDPASLNSLNQASQVKVNLTEIPRTIMLKLNLAEPALADLNVRQAINLAIDRTGITQGILKAPNSEANQIFGPVLSQWHIPQQAAIEQNLATARQLLQQAGWHLNKQGIREKQQQPLKLNLITYANRPELIVIATAIQDQLSQIGIKLAVNMENSSAIPSGHADGSLQMALIARNFGTIGDPLGLILAEFSSLDGGDWGPMNWYNPQVSALLNQLPQQTNPEQYRQTAQQIAKLVMADLPLIPIAYYQQSSAVNQAVEGFSFDPFERNFNISKMSVVNHAH
ncbi:ABC transporter substrate-binding protein [Catenovulum sp. 2E275]|uniref:ABC transporter substrate-binding protein n=1 Tax=Catenovulum sp. 2E275 TaxID=2980497 RepID=UPI0021CF9A66|nr:ABC transporter substrate-binding protein [Catenovulum sp. 2E275]MCU4676933.1 ABC transporter substrate-binding protein [Catenovulum sp. 2E275]